MEETDGMLYKEKFNLYRKVSDELKNNPDKKFNLGGKEYSLAEINNLVPPTEKKVTLFIEWDNICQYTSFGALSKLNQITKQDREFDLKDYLERENFPDGLDYIINKVYGDTDPNLIRAIVKKYYDDIMKMSPTTNFFNRMDLMTFILDKVTFFFKYDCPFLDDFVEDIAKTKFNNRVRVNKIVLPDEKTQKDYMKLTNYDMYIVSDMGLYYKTLLDLKRTNLTVQGYPTHNGINPYIMAYYINEYYLEGIPGPQNINLSFLSEYDMNKEENKGETNDNRSDERGQMGPDESNT